MHVDEYTLYRTQNGTLRLVMPDSRSRELPPGLTITPLGDAFLLDDQGYLYYRRFGENEWRGISFSR